jgi:hypothetical protein
MKRDMQNIIPLMIQQIETVRATAQANEAMKTGALSAEMKRKWKSSWHGRELKTANILPPMIHLIETVPVLTSKNVVTLFRIELSKKTSITKTTSKVGNTAQ